MIISERTWHCNSWHNRVNYTCNSGLWGWICFHKNPVYRCTTETMSITLDNMATHHFADDIFRCIFMNAKFCALIKISLNFAPKGPIDNNPALVWIGLSPFGHQAIISTSADPIHWSIYVALGEMSKIFVNIYVIMAELDFHTLDIISLCISPRRALTLLVWRQGYTRMTKPIMILWLFMLITPWTIRSSAVIISTV